MMNEQPDKPVRIAVLAHALRGGGGLSVGRDLISEMVRANERWRFLFTLPARKEYEELRLDLMGHETVFYKPRTGYLGRLFWDSAVLPGILSRFEPQAVFALGNKGLIHPPCAQAILCHDAHLFYPSKFYANETFSRKAVKAYQRLHLARALKRTQLLLCQTEVARRRLVDTYGFQGRVEICGNAITEEALTTHETSFPEALESLKEKTRLFCLSRYYPHKNLEILVDLFDRYRDELGGYALVLTIAPDQHRRARQLLGRVADLGLDDRIVSVGALPQESLGQYYSNCHALILPTLLESFTRTYIEAMHFGLPILTSDLDFARGLCGDAALYFDPWSMESIKNAILMLNSDSAVVDRIKQLGRKRLEQLQKPWSEIAADTLELLTEMIKR